MNNNGNLNGKLDKGTIIGYAESVCYYYWQDFFSNLRDPRIPKNIINNYKKGENGLVVDDDTKPFFIAKIGEEVEGVKNLYKLDYYNLYYAEVNSLYEYENYEPDACYYCGSDQPLPEDYCIFELFYMKNKKGRTVLRAKLPDGKIYSLHNYVATWQSPKMRDLIKQKKELNRQIKKLKNELTELEPLYRTRQQRYEELSVKIEKNRRKIDEYDLYIKNKKQFVDETKKIEDELNEKKKEKEKIEKEINEAEKTKAGLNQEIDKTEKKKSKLEKKIEIIDRTIDEKEEVSKKKSQYIEELSKKVKEKEKEIEDRTLISQYEVVSQKFEYVMHQIKRIRNYGLGFWEEESPVGRINAKKNKEISMDSMKDLVEHIKKYVSSKSFKYGDRVIECFVEAMFTNQLIILYGPTGTGKTSLPALVSKALDADERHRLVSVQSNWSDEQDLMGFYNVMEKRYIPTDFLDAIVDASKDPENLYFIVLDEMNLAQVEYYFAKILSAMESDDRKITLYSKKDCENARDRIIFKIEHMFRSYFKNRKDMSEEEELKTIREKLEKEIEYDPAKFDSYFELCDEWDNLNRYPAEIELPENIQFIGTINMDASTKNISPKVIDRSFMIEITNGDAGDDLDSDAQMIEPCLLTVESLKKLRSRNTEIDESEIINAINGYVNDLNNNKSTFKVEFSKRSEARVKEMMKGIDEDQSHLVEDDILIGKILPAIRCTGEIGSAPQIKNGRINDKLEKMYDHDFKTLNYWRE